MGHVTTATPVVKYATTPASRRAILRLVPRYQLSSVSKQLVRKIYLRNGKSVFFFLTRQACKVSEGRRNEVILLPPKACWTDRIDFCHIHGSQRRGKEPALNIWLGQTANGSKESQSK